MDTIRVNVCYRPLRICWAISSGDIEAFREAVRLSHAFWGGRYNPIVFADREQEAAQLIESFRADLIVPIGASDAPKLLEKKFAHLLHPFFNDGLFTGKKNEARAQVLDIHNALAHVRDDPRYSRFRAAKLRIFDWSDDDPLRDVLLMHVGAYPADDKKYGYRDAVQRTFDATAVHIDPAKPIPDLHRGPTISVLNRIGIERHYAIRTSRDFPGIYLGDASNIEDLVNCWNLRAADVLVWFIDRKHLPRYSSFLPDWRKTIAPITAGRRGLDGMPAVWILDGDANDRTSKMADAKEVLGEDRFMLSPVSAATWNGLNLQAPMMILGESTQLGVLAGEKTQPKLTFPLGDKPYSDELWFGTQHLVASLSFIGGLYRDTVHTLNLPYIPELNELYARKMYVEYNKFRIEPERIGVIVDASDPDVSIHALPVADLFQSVFELAGISAAPSGAGRIASQIIAQLGGINGAGAFRIPGVRRLIKKHGPSSPFSANAAFQEIGARDPSNPGESSFKDIKYVGIAPNADGTDLTARDVFTYLVEKRLFRVGASLRCSHCRMTSWIPLDELKQNARCEMCGLDFDATRQLVQGEFHYRRSGVLGAERNVQGAIPVTLTLHQLDRNMHGLLHGNMYSNSLDLTPQSADTAPKKCEVDFVWMVSRGNRRKTVVILGECKDRGSKKLDDGSNEGTISAEDIQNLKAVADAFPSHRFETYVLLAKLCPFTEEEVTTAAQINDGHRLRVILLTDRELEPWHFYDRAKVELGIEAHGATAEDLAATTAKIYFIENE